jgi:uncharacterized protein YgbK (DUF1537 family)
LLLGCIADDFTGGTDLAGMLVKSGMRTVQTIGVPRRPVGEDVDAVVIALKSRTNPPEEAVAMSLASLEWLQAQGCRQIYFKYCSTFDSTPRGNIGPVADALMDALGTDFTIACPAFPANGRTIYKGNLFVGDVPLAESGMRHHPLTPMTDSNLVRVLAAQTRHKVGLADYAVVRKGAAAIRERFEALRREGMRHVVVDAISDDDLMEIGRAVADLPLVTAGSGVALGLPQNFPEIGAVSSRRVADQLPAVDGPSAIISGSCSTMTNTQVARARESRPAFQVDPEAIARGEDVAGAALAWADERLGQEPILIYSTAAPAAVGAVQAELGAGQAGTMVEEVLARIATGLVERGVRRMIVAGGETSGAVVKALGADALRIGPEIDPGVPWTVTEGTPERLALALKSGNFGNPDFFLNAWDRLR